MGAMYFIEPEKQQFVYSENYQEFIPLIPLGKNRYLIKFPDGNSVINADTFSFCFDIGMYFGECLIRKSDALYWSLKTKPRAHIDYQRPVISGFAYDQDFTLEWIIVGNAYSFLNRGKKRENAITFQYDYWSDFIPELGKEYIIKSVSRDRQQKLPKEIIDKVDKMNRKKS